MQIAPVGVGNVDGAVSGHSDPDGVAETLLGITAISTVARDGRNDARRP